jgi:hypothetical protein
MKFIALILSAFAIAFPTEFESSSEVQAQDLTQLTTYSY